MSLTTTLLSGAVGGLVATLGAKSIWRMYSRPKLALSPGVIKEGASHPEQMMAWGRYRIKISNHGRSVASNCKPQIRFVGLRETTEREPEIVAGNEVGERNIDVHKRYIIDITPNWNESDSPTRVDLNRGETASFDLFSVHSEHARPGEADTEIQFGDRKSVEEIEETGETWETEPIRIETSRQGDFSRPVVDTAPTLDKVDFEDIRWTEQKFMITSADANKIEDELNLTWNDVIPEVSIK